MQDVFKIKHAAILGWSDGTFEFWSIKVRRERYTKLLI